MSDKTRARELIRARSRLAERAKADGKATFAREIMVGRWDEMCVAAYLGLRPIIPADMQGAYLMPRALR
jgi:hypothetical protein